MSVTGLRPTKRCTGIGAKYARNIWMDVDDESFRGSIAIDERIRAFSRVLSNEFNSYADHERRSTNNWQQTLSSRPGRATAYSTSYQTNL